MQTIVALEYGRYYHIYNRGINGTSLFKEKENYEYFLMLYDKYISCIAETYAWCLMPNHFHLLIQIKEEKDILPLEIYNTKDKEGKKDISRRMINEKKPVPYRQFSHLFNSYAQAFNKRENRHGGLFETPFHRIEVTSQSYFKHLVYYIHNNPVHHGFVQDMIQYPWSSFLTLISVSNKPSNYEKIIGWFNNKQEFITYHSNNNSINIPDLFIE